MATILGIQGIEKIAPQINEVVAGDASLLWFVVGDSNLGKDGHGYGWARRKNIADILTIPVLATYTVCIGIGSVTGSIIFMGDTVADIYPSTLFGDGGQFDQHHRLDYSLLDPLLHPFMPIGAAMVAVDQFVPGVPEPGNGLDAPRYVISHEPTSVGHNFSEDYRLYIAHPIHSTFNGNLWWARKQEDNTYITNGAIDHSPAGAPSGATPASVEIRLVGTVTSDFPGGSGTIQLLPFEILETPTGINCVLSMFAAWPNRTHGYIYAPVIFDGGGSLADYKAALDAAPTMWTKWKFAAACASMLGRRTHAVFEIQSGLNDPIDNSAFQDALRSVVDTLLSIWDEAVTEGLIPANIVGVRVVYQGCPHRISLTGPLAVRGLMAYAYGAAGAVEATEPRLCVANFQHAMTDAETNSLSSDGSHLNATPEATQAANYLKVDKRCFSILVTACRLYNLRRLT